MELYKKWNYIGIYRSKPIFGVRNDFNTQIKIAPYLTEIMVKVI